MHVCPPQVHSVTIAHFSIYRRPDGRNTRLAKLLDMISHVTL